MEQNVCIVCEEEGKPGMDLSEWIEGDEEVPFACNECIALSVVDELESRIKKPWWRTKFNWGFWVLLGGFILFLVTWFIIKPRFFPGAP